MTFYDAFSLVARVCVVILVVVAVVWIPIVQHVSELFHYIQAITSFLAPPVCAVYVLAIFWKRTNEKVRPIHCLPAYIPWLLAMS